MLGDYGFKDTESFEKFAKKKFKKEPANMRFLIVEDKLLTGFARKFGLKLPQK